MSDVWFVKMGGEISGRCMVCMGDEMETRYVVAHDKTKWECEGCNLMGHDELKDMEHLVPMMKKA
jgi:hypothetical protein